MEQSTLTNTPKLNATKALAEASRLEVLNRDRAIEHLELGVHYESEREQTRYGLSLSIPLHLERYRSPSTQAAKAKAQADALRYKALAYDLNAQKRHAERTLPQLFDRIARLKLLLPQNNTLIEMAKTRFESGSGTLFELLSLQTSRMEQQLHLLDLSTQYRTLHTHYTYLTKEDRFTKEPLQ